MSGNGWRVPEPKDGDIVVVVIGSECTLKSYYEDDEVVDRINRMQGSETIVIGAQQYTRKDGKGKANVFANAIKHDFRSPNPTTPMVRYHQTEVGLKQDNRTSDFGRFPKNFWYRRRKRTGKVD